jgi:hypothetical protein
VLVLPDIGDLLWVGTGDSVAQDRRAKIDVGSWALTFYRKSKNWNLLGLIIPADSMMAHSQCTITFPT